MGKFSPMNFAIKWRSSKKLFWLLTSVLWESASCSHHRLCLVSVLVDSMTFHCCFTSIFWIWLWILCCPEAYCNDVFSATFMVSCFSETEEVCLPYMFIQTLCFLFPFQCTGSLVAQLCMWVVRIVSAIHMSLTEQLSPKHDFCLHLQACDNLMHWSKWDSQRTRDILPCIRGIMKTIW